MRLALLMVGIVMLVASGCVSNKTSDRRDLRLQATSLTGQPLYAPDIAEPQRTKLEADLARAQPAYDADGSEENAIWLGRRLGYLGRYREAIEIFTINLGRYPSSYKLLRHRGHRYITVREFDLAIADLTRASFLISDVPDEVEPDGAPNPANIPRSTSHSNIWYHLALAHYLKGEFPRAAECWRECMRFSKNDDMKVATANWLYVSLRRAGKPEEAAQVLEVVKPEMEILENEGYLELLKMYKEGVAAKPGEIGGVFMVTAMMASLGGGAASPTVKDITAWYGMGNWQLINGDSVGARMLFEQVVASPNWAPFGYIAAEAELARMDNAR